MPRVSGSAWPWLLADDSDAIVGIRSGNVDQLFVFSNDDALNIDMSNLAATWNAAGTTFNAIKMNVTDTASAAGSLLLDLQRNAATAFSVAKTGIVRIVDTAANRDLRIEPSTTGAFHRLFSSNTTAGFSFENNVGVLGTFSAATGLGIGSNADLFLNRDAADTLAQRRGTNAQTFRIYNTFTDASNYERINFAWSANVFQILSQAAGTGVGRVIDIGFGATQLIRQNGSAVTIFGQNLVWGTDNAFDIGASGANRPRNLYVASRAIINSLTIGLGGQTAVASNTALGFEALHSASLTGGQTVAVGYQALLSNTSGNNNSAVGALALNSNTTGGSNSAVGREALRFNTTGASNSALGRDALLSNTTGSNNSAVGQSALYYFNTSNNVAVGFEAARGSATVANNTGSELTAVGYQALFSNTSGNANIAVGSVALFANTTGGANNAVGYTALTSNTTGNNNNAVGYEALYSNTTASSNTAVGRSVLQYYNTSNNTAIGFEAARGSATVANNTGSNLTAVGYQALLNNTSGADNSALGYQALVSNTTGNSQTAVGYRALYNNTTGTTNSAVGAQALQNTTTGLGNSAFGWNTLLSNTTGDFNTGLGRQALASSTTGANNSAVGVYALISNTTGSSNSAMGYAALFNNTEGSNNTGLGDEAGDVITTGARNTIVGANSDPSANNGNDQTVIGEGLTGKGNDTAFIGGTNGAYNEKNVTTWETTSDARIKKDIADFADGLEVLEQVRVRSFRYRTPEEITDLPSSAAINQPGVQLGVIAQELQEILPQCVTENSTGVLSVNTDPLVWYLINAVQQLSAEVKVLKGE